MAKAKKSRGAKSRAAVPVAKGLAIAAVAGNFAYRFSGYAMHQDRPWWLTGLGQFKIDANGNLTGAHRSAITAIDGTYAKLTTGSYTLQGSIGIRADGTGDANIHFTETDDTPRKLQAEFFVMLGGDTNRLWFISSGAVLIPFQPPGGVLQLPKPADESVTLEAIRIAFM
jgi:hypothetical protein